MNTGFSPVKKSITAAFLLMGFSALAQDAKAILERVDRNLMPASYVAYRTITDIEPTGKKKEYTLFTVKKGRGKMAGLFLEPASERDRVILRLGDDWWLYFPSVGRPIRQTSLQSVTGGIFNNADVLALDFSAEYDPVIAAENDSEYVLDLTAKTKHVAYAFLKMTVRKDGLLVTSLDCHAASSMLLKKLTFSAVKDFGNGLVRPAVIETTSPLYEGYRSVMIYLRITGKELPDEIFTPANMGRLKGMAR